MSPRSIDDIVLNPAKPLLCLEVNPPRGVELEPVWERLEGELSGVDFLNITDSALARMRISPLPFASLIKQRFGVEPLVNISCRDRNLIAIQADLLAGWTTGVRSVVALTGDAVSVGDSPERKGVFEVNSVGLLNVIKTLNEGKDLAGNELKGAPSFFPGVVVNPNAKNTSVELRRLQKKKEAGARYALSQPVFDLELAGQFFAEAKKIGVPTFVGLLPLKTAKAARGILHVPGMKLSPEIVERIEKEPDCDLSEYSLELCLKIAKGIKDSVCGFHVVSGTTPKLALKLTSVLQSYIRST